MFSKAAFVEGLKAEFERTKLPREVYLEFLKSGFVMGGAITSLHERTPPKDYDIYFNNVESLNKVARTILGSSRGYERKEDGTYGRVAASNSLLNRVVFAEKSNIYETNNALTLSRKLQIITKFIGTPEQIAGTYDWEHCKAYWEPDIVNPNYNVGKFVYLGDSLECIANRRLKYCPESSYYKLCAVSRMIKFQKRGWQIDLASLLKLIKDVGSLDLEDKKVIEHELQGFYGIPTSVLKTIIANYKNFDDLVNKLEELY